MGQVRNIPEGVYDVVIVGGGPAGLTAGLYAARGRMNVLLVESLSVMGQAAMTNSIENYPGIEKTGGFEFVATLKKQAEAFGLDCKHGTVSRISRRAEGGLPLWRVEGDGSVFDSLSVVVASGSVCKKLEVPGEEEFLGKGVSYCGTCDGAFFRDKDIVVVGGGDAAVEEALFLTRFGKTVTLVHRRDRLRAEKVLQERAFAHEKMGFVWDSAVEEIGGTDKVEKVRTRNLKTNETSEIVCDGVFIFVGWKPNTDFLDGLIETDENGYIIVDHEMKTSEDGIFAGGDCSKKHLNQVVTACGDGATAAYSAQQYVDELKGQAYE